MNVRRWVGVWWTQGVKMVDHDGPEGFSISISEFHSRLHFHFPTSILAFHSGVTRVPTAHARVSRVV